MGRHARFAVTAALAAAWLAGSSPARAQEQQPPADDTTQAAMAPEQPGEAKDTGVEKDDPTSRLAWQRGAWGVVTPAFRQLALKEGKQHSNRKRASGPTWFNIGPTGADYEQNGSFTGHVRDSGRARTILPHPTNPNIVYFLSSGGGLWRTTNWNAADTKWTVLTDDLPTTGGGAVAFGRNPNTLYLGLGDPYDQILVGGAMTKSINGGVTWGPVVELGSAVSVRDVQVDTSTNREIVLVATDSGLYRSTDEGATYASVSAFAGQSVWSIVRTSAGWLVSSQLCPATSVGLRCGVATTLYLSTDRGATWAPIANTGNVFANNGRTTLGVALPGDAVVYAYSNTVSDGSLRDVYRSSDGGQTWVANGVNSTKIPTNPVPGSMPDMNICHGQCWYNQMILVDPTDPSRNTLWIGGDLASARSKDGGSTWTIETWWLYSQVPSLRYAHADFHAAAFKTTGTPTIILGNDGGMNISTDDGATFSSDKNNGLVTHLFYTLSGTERFPNLVIGGTQDNGTRLRTDNGTIYNQVIGGDGLGTAYSRDNTNTVMGSAQGSSIRTNLSNTPPVVFQNWVARGALADNAGAGFFTSITPAPAGLDPTGRVFFHFTNSRVWRTNNGGLNWNLIGSATAPLSPGLPGTRRFRSSAHNLGVSPQDLNRIAVGAGGGFLDVTTNGGATWTDINLAALVPGYLGFVSSVTWQDNQTLWITSSAQATGSVRVIKASIASPADSWAGASYAVRQTGLPDLPVNRLYFDPRDPGRNTIYAATHVGVYRTVDGGNQWEPYSNGLPTVRVSDIFMPPDGSFVRIATYGRGIWEMPQVELVATELTDAVNSCDRDGVLDEGEAGYLNITLKNNGGYNVNTALVELSSTNPHLQFTDGNTVQFPPIPAGGQSTGSVRVALAGAAGIEAADISMTFVTPELQLPSGLTLTATHRVNYDEAANASATETAEASTSAWQIDGGAPSAPNVLPWQRRALSPTEHVLWGPDNNGQLDDQRAEGPDEQVLVSPALQVGTGDLVISFSHRFAFENGRWDGGVVEISRDNGATWTDIGTYNGTTNSGTTAPIGASRPAFIERIAGWPNFSGVTLNLGTAYANEEVRIRFRIGADESTGAPGWDIDDIAVSGITNTPFTALVPNAGVCTAGNR